MVQLFPFETLKILLLSLKEKVMSKDSSESGSNDVNPLTSWTNVEKKITRVMKTNDWFIFLQQWCKYQQVLQSKKWILGQAYNRETPWAFLKLLFHCTIGNVQAVDQENSKQFLRNMSPCPGSQKDFLTFLASDCTPNLFLCFPEMRSCRSPIATTCILIKSTLCV